MRAPQVDFGSLGIQRARGFAYKITLTVVAVTAWFAPVARVGRRPYRSSALAGRIEDLRGMELIDPSVAVLLRWVPFLALMAAVAAWSAPFKYRWFALLPTSASGCGLVALSLTLSGSTWTSSTTQLSLCVAGTLASVVVISFPRTWRRGVS